MTTARYSRRLATNVAAHVLTNGWAIVLGAISVPVLLRGLGVEAFGAWALLQALSVTTGWFSLADLGSGSAASRAIARAVGADDVDEARRVAWTNVALAVPFGLASFAAIALARHAIVPWFGVGDALEDDVALAAVFVGAQILLDLVQRSLQYTYEGFQRLDRARSVDALRRTLSLGAATVACAAGADLPGTALAGAAGSLVALLLTPVVGGRGLGLGVARPSSSRAAVLLRQGPVLAVLLSVGVLNRSMNRIVVGVLEDAAAVGDIEIVAQVQLGALSLLTALSYVAVSSAAWIGARGDDRALRDLLLKGTRYSLLATLPLIVVVAVLARPMVQLWLGDDATDVAELLPVALAYVLVISPSVLGSSMLQGLGHERQLLRIAAIGSLVNLGLTCLLVALVGTVGALLATVLVAAVIGPIQVVLSCRATHTPIGRFARLAVLPTLPVAAGAGAGAWLGLLVGSSDAAELLVGGAAALVLAALAAWPAIDRDDLSALRRPPV